MAKTFPQDYLDQSNARIDLDGRLLPDMADIRWIFGGKSKLAGIGLQDGYRASSGWMSRQFCNKN